jgi:hypothetical protein
MRTLLSVPLLIVSLLEACGGRVALDLDPPQPIHADAAGGSGGTSMAGAGGSRGKGALGTGGSGGTGVAGAGGQLGSGGAVDAAFDAPRDGSALDVLALDAPLDACTPLDPNEPCGCPAGDWYVELETLQARARLTAPHVLKLYCAEETPIAATNGCNDVVRLSACAGPANQPPCFYLAASPTLGFFTGFLALDNQASHVVISGAIELSRDEPPVREGSFMASARIGGSSVPIQGRFRACAAPYGR